MTNANDLVYTTYIRTTPEKVWAAITNPEFTQAYWSKKNVSDWKTGSDWNHVDPDTGATLVTGKVLESAPPRRLVLSWASAQDAADESQVTFEIEAVGDMVRLEVTHAKFSQGSGMRDKVSGGWPRVISSMKTWLETGMPLDTWAAYGTSCHAAA
ncbi:MAG TPA: SRPBCC family protein [Patescibacteria group bacterium]|nr:SRPBCC family protein [Patescibacteria group bacterium]